MAAHTHTPRGSEDTADTNEPSGNVLAKPFGRGNNLYKTSGTQVDFRALSSTGGSQEHNNNQLFIAINLIIALQGLYPSRG